VVSGNTVANLGPSVGFTTPVGYWLSGSVASIKSNVLSHAPGGYGIYTGPSYAGTTISSNKVSDTYVGLYADTVTANSVFQSNTVSNTTYAIADLSSGGGNNITKNTVNEASFGIYETTPVADTLTPNTYYNTVVTIDPNPFTNPGGNTPY
jgi:parallel beta-helix repeat protein